MKYTNILLNKETEENKNLFKLLLLVSIVSYFIPMAILYYAMPNKLLRETKELALAYVNLQLILFLVSLTGILAPIAWFINLIVALVTINQVANEQPVKVPVIVEILKMTSPNQEVNQPQSTSQAEENTEFNKDIQP